MDAVLLCQRPGDLRCECGTARRPRDGIRRALCSALMSAEPEQVAVALVAGAMLRAELFDPSGGDGPFPGVLILHESFGLNGDIRRIARRFADASYVAIARDLYSHGARLVCLTRVIVDMLRGGVSREIADILAVREALAERPEVNPEQIGVYGLSFGSFAATVVGGAEPRYRAVAAQLTLFEPGFHHIFEEASPTFKQRFMYMSGYTDEAAFEPFRKTLTWEGYAEKIRAPYLCVAGECDELSPMEYTEKVMKTVGGPKRLVVYAEARHALGAAASATLGPNAWILSADWMLAALSGKTFPSERWFVDPTGRITKTAL